MIGVIAKEENDVTKVLSQNFIEYQIINPAFQTLEDYSSLVILGGTYEAPLSFDSYQRSQIETFIESGKKVWAEFVSGINTVTMEDVTNSRFERLVYLGKDIEGLKAGEIMDNQATLRVVPFQEVKRERTPFLAFSTEHVHSAVPDDTLKEKKPLSQYAGFFERENVLYTSVQLANFHRNRYTPAARVQALISSILEWVTDQEIIKIDLEPIYSFYPFNQAESRQERQEKLVKRALSWFEHSGTLIRDGAGGVYEGFATEINHLGIQKRAETIRADCMGEAALLYDLASVYFKDDYFLEVSKQLQDKLKKEFIITSGKMKGFVRWSNVSYQSSYGDDAARMVIPLMLSDVLHESQDNRSEAQSILTHLVETTGPTGLRKGRVELEDLYDSEHVEYLQTFNEEFVSVHYNAYYHAALLLGYYLYGDEEYLNTAEKGLRTLMQAYPETLREQSQTQEEARFIFPLAMAYLVTKNEQYKRFLEKIMTSLEKRKTDVGCYLEWDEGYLAVMRNTEGDGECSLLSHNGDTIADLLYTNNWLPLAFSFAYLVTKETSYEDKFNLITDFFYRSQMKSNDKKLDGAWARGFDPELFEYFGSPADKGWGPYCIESGWTVAQIGAGTLFGLMLEEFEEKIKNAKWQGE